MGQAANSNRNASLDNKKERAAGRSGRTGERSSVRKAVEEPPMKGATGGAFGADGKANRMPAGFNRGGGGGGGTADPGRDEARNPAGRSKRPVRKRK
jgi:hypothetical protein